LPWSRMTKPVLLVVLNHHTVPFAFFDDISISATPAKDADLLSCLWSELDLESMVTAKQLGVAAGNSRSHNRGGARVRAAAEESGSHSCGRSHGGARGRRRAAARFSPGESCRRSIRE
jgi:hypothetical protein